MKLREFLSKAVYTCTEDTMLADRITKQLLLMYDYELKEAHSVFAMTPIDLENPKGRIEYAFAFKHLRQIDEKKAQRIEDLVYLLSLNHYQNKYGTDIYAKEITTLSTAVAEDPIQEVDSLMSTEANTQGSWSD